MWGNLQRKSTLESAFDVAWLRTETDSNERFQCARMFVPDIDELLDAIDFAERDLKLFTSLMRRTPHDGSASVWHPLELMPVSTARIAQVGVGERFLADRPSGQSQKFTLGGMAGKA